MIKVSVYTGEQKSAWDNFLASSKNGLFIFKRDYMEYHSERFSDHSLLFFQDGLLMAIMPASLDSYVLTSHGGLTFGGVVSDSRMKTETMLELFSALKMYLGERGVSNLIYKAVPHIYHSVPAEEDLYALHQHGAALFRRDVSSTINMVERLPFSKGRKWAAKQARKHGLDVARSFDFATFMGIEERVLTSKYGTKPVHTGDEIAMLAGRFPDNIKLFASGTKGEMLAGVIIYESDNVAHAQYISATEEGKQTCALDLILEFLINDYYSGKRYFDFGISTEDGGRYLNSGLIANKQSYGARAVVHDFYELKLRLSE